MHPTKTRAPSGPSSMAGIPKLPCYIIYSLSGQLPPTCRARVCCHGYIVCGVDSARGGVGGGGKGCEWMAADEWTPCDVYSERESESE